MMVSLSIACAGSGPVTTQLQPTDVPQVTPTTTTLLATAAAPPAPAPSAPPAPGLSALLSPSPSLPPSLTAATAVGAPTLVDPRDNGLAVGLGEWAVTLESSSIRPGSVTFVIRNRGTHVHGFRVRSDSSVSGDRTLDVRTARIQPGGESALTVTLPVGNFEVDCFVEEAGVGEHDELGMRAQLVVRDDSPLVTVQPTAQPSSPAPNPTVSIQGFAFAPEVLQVSAGTAVVWTNNDPAPHTVTADDRSFDSAILTTSHTFRRVFDAPGTFRYMCSLHPTMKGRVEVKAPGQP